MNTALFYDTETTGFPAYKLPSSDPSQPHIVQLAACLVDLDSRNTISCIDLIIDNKVPIPSQASDVHGIDEALAAEVGVTPDSAIRAFIGLWKQADFRVAHNENFDARILRIALFRAVVGHSDLHDQWKNATAVCTMKLSNPLTAAEGSIGTKWPKLTEACRILMDMEIVDAHSAMPDVQGCMALYFHCIDQDKTTQTGAR